MAVSDRGRMVSRYRLRLKCGLTLFSQFNGPSPTIALGRRPGTGDNSPMRIILNGEAIDLSQDHATIVELLVRHGLAESRVAVEVNGAIVPRSRHNEHRLNDGDTIEIVHALGGG
jgi:sulfur carrier protein